MTLGQALAQHRGQCAICTAERACIAYLDIARRYTAARQILVGSTAPHLALSVREPA